MGWRVELLKNWRQRLSALTLILALLVLVDELVKEGYSVDLRDFTAWPPFTHEQLFLLLLVLGLLLGFRR
jgi:hypothetical protein